jgi:hypothetical protein
MQDWSTSSKKSKTFGNALRKCDRAWSRSANVKAPPPDWQREWR